MTRLRSKLRAIVLAGVCLVAGAGPAFAHRIGIPISTVSPNPRSGMWEVVHKVPMHDLDTLLGPGLAQEGLLIDSQEGLEAIRAYALENFLLAGESETIVVDWLGVEIDGETAWVYGEFSSPDQSIIVTDRLLFDDNVPGTHALVNVKAGDGKIVTGIFEPGQPRARARLCWESCPPR